VIKLLKTRRKKKVIGVDESGNLTVTYTDGNTKNIGNIKGPRGDKGIDGLNGKDGNGIVNMEVDESGNLTVTYT
jgi:hypothetical protein